MGQTRYKYYDNGDIARIQKMVAENRLESALTCYYNYIDKYPTESLAQILCADVLIKLGMFDKAEDLLNTVKLKSRLLNDSIRKLVLMRIKLFCCQQKYEQALSILEENRDYIGEYKNILLFLKKRLNILTREDYQYSSYLTAQILDYSEDRCLQHLTKHQYHKDNSNVSQFMEDFPIRNIYFKLREGLPEYGRIYSSCTNYLSVFRYDNNGRVNGKVVDYFEVVALNHSSDIITMYPYLNKERRPYTDITPSITEGEYSKVKRMSQIDKFNQRYQK